MSLSRTTRRISLPALLAVVLATALLAAGPGCATPAGASASTAAAAGGGHPAKPVIVLEHGAWADASSWSSVISRLQRRGFTVYAPLNPQRGLPEDSAYLHDFLTQNAALAGQPVVLVGHSHGGAVITNAAAGDPEVKALVYVDAFIPDQGETLASLAGLVSRESRAGVAGHRPAHAALNADPRRHAVGRLRSEPPKPPPSWRSPNRPQAFLPPVADWTPAGPGRSTW